MDAYGRGRKTVTVQYDDIFGLLIGTPVALSPLRSMRAFSLPGGLLHGIGQYPVWQDWDR